LKREEEGQKDKQTEYSIDDVVCLLQCGGEVIRERDVQIFELG
jgi:hypothetical protein